MHGLHSVHQVHVKAESSCNHWIGLGQPQLVVPHLGGWRGPVDGSYISVSPLIRLAMQTGLGTNPSRSTVNGPMGLDRLGHLTRKPQRISITIPYGLYEACLLYTSDAADE